MGVHDLWRLLSPSGRKISIDFLEGKALAIDISIWIVQFNNAMVDSNGAIQKNAHILGTLRRILKLLFNGIFPIFVFDGPTPRLKKFTVARRRSQIEKQKNNQFEQRILLKIKNAILSGSDLQHTSNPNMSDSLVDEKEIKESTDVDKVLEKSRLDYSENLADFESGLESFRGSKPTSLHDYVNELRKRERILRRESYLPIASDPDAFSKNQIANFILASKMNTKIADIGKSFNLIEPESENDEPVDGNSHVSRTSGQESDNSEWESESQWESEPESCVSEAYSPFDKIESTESDTVRSDVCVDVDKPILDELTRKRAIEMAYQLTDWAGHHVQKELSGLKSSSKSIVSSNTFSSLPDDEDVDRFVNSEPASIDMDHSGFVVHADESMDWTSSLSHDAKEESSVTDSTPYYPSRNNRTVSYMDEFRIDIIELLQTFNLPFLVAPGEAEAQCAQLEMCGLVDGIVTEDSDVFLFGASNVYKNLFLDKKYVEAYVMKDIESDLGLDREDLIALAFLLGSDYSEGIHGVGIVNALEILEAFRDSSNNRALTTLRAFRKWWESDRIGSNQIRPEKDNRSVLSSTVTEFDKKHTNARSRWSLPDSFPLCEIYEAYCYPSVNKDNNEFKWMVPDRDIVTKYCLEKLGWNMSDVTNQIFPVVDRIIERSSNTSQGLRQSTLDRYVIRYQDNKRVATVYSDRLNTSIDGLSHKKKRSNK